MQVPTFSVTTAQRTAKVAAAGFGVVALFQLLLALGAPWGRAALGGYNEGTLPPELRVVSLVSMALFLGAGFVVLGRAGHWGARGVRGAARGEVRARGGGGLRGSGRGGGRGGAGGGGEQGGQRPNRGGQ